MRVANAGTLQFCNFSQLSRKCQTSSSLLDEKIRQKTSYSFYHDAYPLNTLNPSDTLSENKIRQQYFDFKELPDG